jgi:N-acetylneuraminic acid mutarotase
MSSGLRAGLLAMQLLRGAHGQAHVSWSAEEGSSSPGERAMMAVAPQSLAGVGGAQLEQRIWMYGGVSSASPLNYSAELWAYTTSSKQWDRAAGPTAANAPPELIGATMCAVGHTLYLYGGANFDAPAHDGLYLYDTSAERWWQPVLSGFTPPARAFHAAACDASAVYVFGGVDGSSTPTATLYVLDGVTTSSMGWAAVAAAGAAPSARHGHTLTASPSRLYLFGGEGATSANYLNDVYALVLSSREWTSLATSGDAPAGRRGHAAAAVGERLYVFGGQDADGILNDVRVLDLRYAAARRALAHIYCLLTGTYSYSHLLPVLDLRYAAARRASGLCSTAPASIAVAPLPRPLPVPPFLCSTPRC